MPFGHRIELGFFFHGYRIIGLTLENLNWQKCAPRDFSNKSLIIVHKAAFVSVKNLAIPLKMSGSTRVPKRAGYGRSCSQEVRLDSIDDVSINYIAYPQH